MNLNQYDEIIEEDDRNSFLVETTFNSDIGVEVRKEIEEKFKNSKANQNYVFPRMAGKYLNQSRRNLSNFRSKNRTNRLESNQKQQEILKIYSREQLVLKQIQKNFTEQMMQKSRSNSKKHGRGRSSPFRSKSPNNQTIESISNVYQNPIQIRKNHYFGEGHTNHVSFLPKLPTGYMKLTSMMIKNKKQL